MSDAGHWRACAAALDLVIATAVERGSNPLLVAKMRQDAARYRAWAGRADAGAAWVVTWLPSESLPRPLRGTWRWRLGFAGRLPELPDIPDMLTPAEPLVTLGAAYSEPARGNEESTCPVAESLTSR
jgi:hypothetical protein